MNELYYQYTQDLKRCEFLFIDFDTKEHREFVLDLTNPDCESLTKWFNTIFNTILRNLNASRKPLEARTEVL